MDQEADSLAPLLSTQVHVVTDYYETDHTQYTGSKRTLSFLSGYEALNGVPAKRLSPQSNQAAFTCHAFSPDGYFLVTGDSKGTLLLWTTRDYSLLTTATLFESPIGSVGFRPPSKSLGVVIDQRGNLKEVLFSLAAPPGINQVEVIREFNLEENWDRDRDFWQISDDGRTILAAVLWPEFDLDIFKIEDTKIHHKRIDIPKLFALNTPVLSPNGSSLMAYYKDPNPKDGYPYGWNMYIWADLPFDGAKPRSCWLVQFRAEWGLGGEYLLSWWDGERRDKPELHIYRSQDFTGSDIIYSGQPYRRQYLAAGLVNWSAQMLHPEGDSPQVYIYETYSSGKRRILIWDLVSDLITREVDLDLPDLRGALGYSRKSFWGQVGDSLPVCCCSADGKWVGVMSLAVQSCAICSVESGVTIWSFALPREVQLDSLQIKFDPDQQHFLLVSRNSILAHAPAFLSLDDSMEQCRTESLPHRLNILDNRYLASAFHSLPSEASAQLLSSHIEDNSLEWGVYWRVVWRDAPVDHFVDVALSSSRIWSSYIAANAAGETAVISLYVKDSIVMEKRILAGGDFAPERIFLFGDGDEGKRQGLALISSSPIPSVAICKMSFDSRFEGCGIQVGCLEEIELDMERCHRVTQTGDRRRLILLDSRSVCLFDLYLRCISARIEYQVDFSNILNKTGEEIKWKNNQSLNIDRRISEDGHKVLIGWETGSVSSIVITPATTPTEADFRLENANISEFCTLARDGQSTTFLEIDPEANDRITVGVFSEKEQKVMNRVHVKQLAASSHSKRELSRVLGQIFHGLSDDGERLVILSIRSDKDLHSEIKTFTVYGIPDCMPNYDQLISHNTVQQSLKELFNKFGGAAFNLPNCRGLSIFQEALRRKNNTMLDTITSLATENPFKLTLELQNRTTNFLKQCLDANCSNDLKKAVHFLGSDLTPFVRSAAILRSEFKRLLLSHQEIMTTALSEDLFVVKAGPIKVHVDFLKPVLRQDKAVHICTSNTFLDWSHCGEEDVLAAKWRERRPETVSRMERSGNTSTTTAVLVFVGIADAAKVGMEGIIRPLLLQKMPEDIFKCSAVKWVINYKWHKIWKRRFLKNAITHFSLLCILVIYSVSIAKSAALSEDSIGKKLFNSAMAFLILVFGIHNLAEEVREVKTFIQDGMQHYKDCWWGVQHFVDSRWNWLDVTSCLLLLILIPLFHSMAVVNPYYDNHLSAAVAVESILAFVKVWFFAQPFRVSGALVLMIDNIVRDMVTFLALGFVIMVGFGLSLHVLFRSCSTDEDIGLASSFDTFSKSLLTLFFALSGNFETEDFLNSGDLFWLVTAIFILYLTGETIVLLNLLISIMGDTFDRVKSTEEAQLLMARAKFVDACEAGLTVSEIESINKRIGTYVCVLMSEDGSENIDTTDQWMGKLNMLEECFRRDILKSERRIKKMIQELQSLEAKPRQSLSDLQPGRRCIQ